MSMLAPKKKCLTNSSVILLFNMQYQGYHVDHVEEPAKRIRWEKDKEQAKSDETFWFMPLVFNFSYVVDSKIV